MSNTRDWNKVMAVTSVAVAVTAIVGLIFQVIALRQSWHELAEQREGIAQQLNDEYTHRQKVQALELYDDWQNTLDASTRSHVSRMRKWLKDYPPAGSDEHPKQRDAWLRFFVLGSELPETEYRDLLGDQPDHIMKAFGETTSNGSEAASTPAALTIEQVDAIRHDIVKTLNLCEKIAIAYNSQLADQGMLDYGFKSIVSKYTLELNRFILDYREAYRDHEKKVDDAWQPLYDLVLETDGNWHEANNSTD